MGLFSRSKPKIKIQAIKKDSFSGWVKCPGCSEMIHSKQLEDNLHCCPKCDYHYRLSGSQRVAIMADEGSFQEFFSELEAADPLNFVDSEPYVDRIKKAVKSSGRNEAVITGLCTIEKIPVALGVMDFSFMAGSMGSVVGERLTRLIEMATENRLPLVIVTASGGARMQESTLSLMQMAKTSSAIARHSEAKLPYIAILTNPTTGGVTASFATLGDILIAEPDALIAFAGPRVVEQTIRHKLPPGAQRSEFLLKHGMIDCIAPRSVLKAKLKNFLEYLMPATECKTTALEKLKKLIEAKTIIKTEVPC